MRGVPEDSIEPLGPRQAIARIEPPRIAESLDVLKRLGAGRRKRALRQGEVAAQVDDGVHDVDTRGTLLDARHAGRAGP